MSTVNVHLIARLESKRVQRKNLRLLHGKPLLAYAIEAAKSAETIDRVFLNTESELLADIGRSYGIEVFIREPWLAADDIVLDQTTYAFTKAHPSDIVGMVNPVCPLTTGADIDAGLAHFREHDLDTLLTVREEQLHSFICNQPINIDTTQKIPMTQDLDPIQVVTWNFCFWKRAAFLRSYDERGFGVFNGKIGLFPLDKRKAIKVSDEADFRIAEALIAHQANELPPADFWDGP
jgi:CMP-N-acetylneuraminic acid synthetase